MWWVEEALSNFSLSDHALKVRKPLAFKASTPNRETNQKPGAREVGSISPSLLLFPFQDLCASARPSSPCVRSTSERFHYIISVLQIHPQSHGGSGCLTSHATVRRIGCPQTLGAAPSPPLCAASCPNSSRGDPDPGSAITRRPGPRLHPLSHEPLSGPPHTL